jgi:DNA-binding transcriptional ArsR family regulator
MSSSPSPTPVRRADLIIHPVRLRIIQMFGAGQRLTAQHVSEMLPDIPHASLYRHLKMLVEGGVLEVVEERPVRAVYEKVYALVPAAANVGPAEYGSQSAAEHRTYFTTFLGLLLGDFERYLAAHPAADVRTDGIAYYQMPLYLSDEEYQQLVASLRAVLAPLVAHGPTPDRRRRLLSLIAMPAAGAPSPRHADSHPELQPADEPSDEPLGDGRSDPTKG